MSSLLAKITVFILFIVLILLIYYGYCVANDIDPFQTLSEKISLPQMSSTPPQPDTNATGYCTFEGTDLDNVFTRDGKKPTVKSFQCNQCNQYIFKDDSGCSPYMYDSLQNNSLHSKGTFDSLATPHSVCTVDVITPIQNCPF